MMTMQEKDIELQEIDELQEVEGSEEMYEHFAITVDKGQKMLRLDKFLVDRMEHFY